MHGLRRSKTASGSPPGLRPDARSLKDAKVGRNQQPEKPDLLTKGDVFGGRSRGKNGLTPEVLMRMNQDGSTLEAT